jgi:hypothetical protein
MSDFIVLGLIPGTNIQIGFLSWLGIIAILFGVLYLIHYGRRTNKLRLLLISASLAWTTARSRQRT